MSWLFLRDFPFKGSLVKPNLVPLDKFKPENEIRAFEYLNTIFNLDLYKILFVDEKHLGGEEIFSRKVRNNPLDNSILVVATTSDFCTTYNVTGFCSISKIKRHPIWYRITSCNNNADEFYHTCEMAGQDGFFEHNDVIVADNATVHSEAADMLW